MKDVEGYTISHNNLVILLNGLGIPKVECDWISQEELDAMNYLTYIDNSNNRLVLTYSQFERETTLFSCDIHSDKNSILEMIVMAVADGVYELCIESGFDLLSTSGIIFNQKKLAVIDNTITIRDI